MEYITLELDCTDNTCGGCRLLNRHDDCGCMICAMFDKHIKQIIVDGRVSDYERLPECIAACKSRKALRNSQKDLTERWKDTLKCPECGSKNLNVETSTRFDIGTAYGLAYVQFIECLDCGFVSRGSKPIDCINNERKRIYEKWKNKAVLSDLEKAEIS